MDTYTLFPQYRLIGVRVLETWHGARGNVQEQYRLIDSGAWEYRRAIGKPIDTRELPNVVHTNANARAMRERLRVFGFTVSYE